MEISRPSQQTFERLERRIARLEDALGVNRISSKQLDMAIKELLDLRQTSYRALEGRPTVTEGLQKYQDLLRMADEQEGIPSWNSGLHSEILFNELSRLRVLSSTTESLKQMEPVLNEPPSGDFQRYAADLRSLKTQLASVLAKVEKAERTERALTEAQTAAITMTEDKLVEINDGLRG
ncbi:hypothetical protein RvY_10412 [Ramazzottius varieornatus]|uniref:Uncharacterized protein n=1 Tax=Ramazzottius varieornatus TaxID=947166 RepID=A0A1D1VH53_RAMVA|nr:hypothetical protein RvY_10412 [Ramazzottius varieornatus]